MKRVQNSVVILGLVPRTQSFKRLGLWVVGTSPTMTKGVGQKVRVNAEVRLAISTLAGEMSDRTEGGNAAPVEFAVLPPSVAYSDISPARVEIENSPHRFPV